MIRSQFLLNRLLGFGVGLFLTSIFLCGDRIGQVGAARLQAIETIVLDTSTDRLNASNISSALLNARAQILSREDWVAPGETVDYTAFSSSLVQVNADRDIHAYLYVTAFTETERAQLQAYDVQVEVANPRFHIVQAWIPVSELHAVGRLPFVTRLTSPHYATMSRGRMTTEGNAIAFVDALRELGFDGSGVRIAVISDGANNHAAAVDAGTLPADISVFGTCVPLPSISCDVGTGMLEIIHAVAPGAELAIGGFDFTRTVTSMDFVRRVDEIVEAFNPDIMVHTLRFYQEPYFEDGVVAQHVAEVAAGGVLYVLPAGDEAQNHYEANFVSTSSSAVNLHDFGRTAGQPSDTTMDILVEPGQSITVFLQWDDPFGSSSNDYTLFLVDEAETTTLAAGREHQDGDDNPQETAFYTNESSLAVRVKIIIAQVAGRPGRIEMMVLGGAQLEEYGVPSGSIIGAAGVPEVLTIGAIQTSDPDVIEPFSAWGTASIAFPRPIARIKPDVVATNGQAVLGSDGLLTRFVGTTAASANVVGIAALLRQAVPTATSTDIRRAIMAGAVDLGETGLDNVFGAGRVNALAAFQTFFNQAPSVVIDTPASDVTIAQEESVAFSATGMDPDGHVPLSFSWDFGGGAPHSTLEDPGLIAFNTPGTFIVTLTVTDRLGLTGGRPATRRITVSAPNRAPNHAPNGEINTPAGGVTIELGESVNFTATGRDPDDNLPLSFRWDFGGGAPVSTQEDPGHVVFNTAGDFTVSLRVTDSLGLSDPSQPTRQIQVTPTQNRPPNGVIDNPGASGVAIQAGASVLFSATGTDPDSNLPLSFRWDFGGGATDTTAEDPGQVTFSKAGFYTVRLTVIDALGLSDPTPAMREIVVSSIP